VSARGFHATTPNARWRRRSRAGWSVATPRAMPTKLAVHANPRLGRARVRVCAARGGDASRRLFVSETFRNANGRTLFPPQSLDTKTHMHPAGRAERRWAETASPAPRAYPRSTARPACAQTKYAIPARHRNTRVVTRAQVVVDLLLQETNISRRAYSERARRLDRPSIITRRRPRTRVGRPARRGTRFGTTRDWRTPPRTPARFPTRISTPPASPPPRRWARRPSPDSPRPT
jgi:hypothetical protein